MMRYFVLLIILFSFNFVFSQSDRKHARDGNKNYFDSLFIKSEVNYRKALAKNPSFEEGKFNLSNSLFKQNRFEESEVVLKDFPELVNEFAASKRIGTFEFSGYWHDIGSISELEIAKKRFERN